MIQFIKTIASIVMRPPSYRLSYSQYGEDMILRAMFARYPVSYKGFYIDVGAHHPKKWSNTYCFYKLGWRGIDIDPLPGVDRLFKLYRPRDIFIQAGVADQGTEMDYYVYASSAMNTFSKDVMMSRKDPALETFKMLTLPLGKLLSDKLSPGQTIDFFSIDVEGFELQVLHSNDWERFRPRVVVIEELLVGSIDNIKRCESDEFLLGVGYKTVCRTPSALFYVDTRSSACDETAFLNVVM